MAVTGTDFVTLPTRDFEASKVFYRDTLGLEEGKDVLRAPRRPDGVQTVVGVGQ